MSCLKLVPESSCGSKGSCVTDENGTSACICEFGWSQTKEFSFWTKDKSLDVCKYHEEAIQGLWFVISIIAMVSLSSYLIGVIHSSQTRAKIFRRLKQSSIIICAALAGLIAALYRYTHPDGLFGHDVVFTFFNAQTLFLISFGGYRLFLTVINRFVGKTEWTSTDVERLVRTFTARQGLFAIFDFAFAQLLWLACFLVEEKQLLLIRGWALFTLLRDVHLYWFCRKFYNQYKDDLSKVTRFKGNLSPEDKLPDELLKWKVFHLKKSWEFIIQANINICFAPFYKFLPLISDMIMSNWVWGNPIILLSWYVMFFYWSVRSYILRLRKMKIENSALLMGLADDNSPDTRNKFPKHLQSDGNIVRTYHSSVDAYDSDDSDDELI